MSANGTSVTRDRSTRGTAADQPRLLALRLQGFKSFADRTNVEFGAGISAVVGPNGSGKSNLADALRWALGEQGRALRSRKAEDVIWAGSDKRAAQGMADVTLVVDNADGLLPVDFQVLELGRRLYRSGENDYLLNKQRIRLRDLVDLLDAAHLADNAFLFIGQGMVDQALALRPEERRPLFEEVAGVRRHERRRRRAQEQLVESEANLARVEDILAELRPQARRLAAQAEQQASRQSTADELIGAVLASAHGRWHAAAARVTAADARRDAVRAETDRAMAAMAAAESEAAALADALGARAALERDRRDAHETARTALERTRLDDARLSSEVDGSERERARLADERAAAEADLATARRAVAEPIPARDVEAEMTLGEAERALAEALAELATLRAASQAEGEGLAAVRRAAAAREAELETARRRLAELGRRSADDAGRIDATRADRIRREAAAAAASEARDAAVRAETESVATRDAARANADRAEAERAAAERRLGVAQAALESATARRDALAARLDEEERRGIAKAARRAGGRRLDEDLVVEAGLRSAVEAALSDTARAYVVPAQAITGLAAERGALVIDTAAAGSEPSPGAAAGFDADRASAGRERRFRDALVAAGGGHLVDAIRRDGTGAAVRVLARAAWLPDLSSCLAIQAALPPGWVVVTRDGSAVVTETGVVLGAPDSILERRAEAIRLSADVDRLDGEVGTARRSARTGADLAAEARAALDGARAEEARAAALRRVADEAERAAARDLEAIVRESAWLEAQAERQRQDLERATAAVAALESARADAAAGPDAAPERDAAAIDTWEARATGLRARRDRLAEEAARRDGARRDAEGRHARADAIIAGAEERIRRVDREAAALEVRVHDLAVARERVRIDLAAATAIEAAAREALAAVHAADTTERERLAEAERTAADRRESLRAADERRRIADRDELEARLGLDALRDAMLVEIAALGSAGVAGLTGLVGGAVPGGEAAVDGAERLDRADDGVDPDGEYLVSVLERAGTVWASTVPTEAAPSPGRLAQLRRRYHELGASNPYAVDEFAELRQRLETLETQGADLVTAIARTRDLIAELETMITDQFATTFRALEEAFEARFEQLFGGGYARLSLTDPSDLGTTGVEIVARPPGKKPQALAMLSGGERALTAVALLFAMLEVRPVPFCVLDEVDAALDEANIGRFADALRSLAGRTQCIVITHNRGTIEAADALYGVTVGDDSVSRVISLRLEEAQALADRRRGELASAG